MSSESEDQWDPELPVESKVESQKKSKKSYSRDFLLSFSELDICKRLPAGFDTSILSEFEDASYCIPERQRNAGGLSLHSSRYGSSPPNRVDNLQSYSRGSQGRWDTRSSGSNDRDGDSQSDWDSVAHDSGKRYGNQSRRSWQNSEHDGLLGSGAFPRPSGYTGGPLAAKTRGNDHYLLSRSSEPYHPPRPYKALPHSRRDTTDAFNDETFGSAECSSLDREEEERKRRASFELMRKEQQKALQEKLNHPDKHKGQLDDDIGLLLESSVDGKSILSKSDDILEDHVAPVSHGDSGKHAFPTQAPPSRPLVPPGFVTAILEKNLGSKSLVASPAVEVGNAEDNVTHVNYAKHSVVGDGPGNAEENGKLLGVSVTAYKQQDETETVGIPFININEKIVIPSSVVEVVDHSFGFKDPPYKNKGLQEDSEGWVENAVTDFESKKVARCGIEATDDQDKSSLILEKLFGNALAVNSVGSPTFIKNHDVNLDADAWSTVPSQSSKFAHWFHEEDKKPVNDHLASTAGDLLSLIVSNDKGGAQLSTVSDERVIECMPTSFLFENNEVSQKLITSTAALEGLPETLSHHEKTDPSSGVLTCEDLEQAILAEANDSRQNRHSMQGAWSASDEKVKSTKADVDDLASQHLLSLLQKGTSMKEPTSSPCLGMGSNNLGILGVTGVADAVDTGGAEYIHNTEKTLTLETLFGKAFMKELHSVGAPVSAQRGSGGLGTKTVASESHGFPFSIASDGVFHSSVDEYASNKPNHERNCMVSSHPQEPLFDKIQGDWLGFDDPRSNGSKAGAVLGFDDRADESLEMRLPEEESLITVGDPVNQETSKFMPVHIAAKREKLISSEAPIEIVDKLAALNAIIKDERSIAPGLDGPPIFRGPYNSVESELPYQHLHGRPSSPQFPHQTNQARPSFLPLDLTQRNPQISMIGHESIHHEPQHSFPPNIFHHPFHGPGGPRFDPASHSLLPHMPPMPANFPPPMLQGLPRGVPLSHPMNHLPGYIPELNPVQGFPMNHRQPNYSGLGMGIPGSVGGVANHPEVLERMMEMELRANPKQMPPTAGPSPGIYGAELDMAFRYR